MRLEERVKTQIKSNNESQEVVEQCKLKGLLNKSSNNNTILLKLLQKNGIVNTSL